jgi:hypothetical protein
MSIENIIEIIAFVLLCLVFYIEYFKYKQTNNLKIYKKYKRIFLISSILFIINMFIIFGLLDPDYTISKRLYLTNLSFILYASFFYLCVNRNRIKELFKF